MRLEKLFDLRYIALKAERRSEKTLNHLRLAQKRFTGYLKESRLSLEAEKIGAYEIRAFSVFLDEANLTPETQSFYIRTLRALFRWGHLEGLLPTNIAEKVKPPKVPKKVVPALSEAQVKRLFEVAKGTRYPLRDHSLVVLLFDCGLRSKEVCLLDLEDINWEAQQVRVHGKGEKERVVPIGFHALKALMRYVERERPEYPGCRSVYFTGQGDRMTYECLHQMLDRLAVKAEIPRLRPHMMRHSFARAYLRNGGDVFSLQKILGHSSLEMTRRYAELDLLDVQNVHRRSSPADRLKTRRK